MKYTGSLSSMKMIAAVLACSAGIFLMGSGCNFFGDDSEDYSIEVIKSSLHDKADELFGHPDEIESSDISSYEPEVYTAEAHAASGEDSLEPDISDMRGSDAPYSSVPTTTVPVTTEPSVPALGSAGTSFEVSDAAVLFPSVSDNSPPAQTTIATTSAQPEKTTLSDAPSRANVVYIAASGNGKKYHKVSSCSNMKGTIEMTVSEAEAAGYTPCKKKSCYG